MIIVKKHIVSINFERGGIRYPYAMVPAFDPNKPPAEYGQARQISLYLITDKQDYFITEPIIDSGLPLFKIKRQLNSKTNFIITLGYKIGYIISSTGYRVYKFFDLQTGNITAHAEKL